MAFQRELWQKFYENAWDYRAKIMQKALQNGANSYQAIKELEKIERIYSLEQDENGEISLKKREIENGNSLSFADVSVLKASSMNGKFLPIPQHANFSFADFLIDVFEGSGGDYECIIELGCGYGRNLFEIFYRGGRRDLAYFGGEFTQSGVKIANELAKATPNMSVKFFHFNHLEPNLDQIKALNFNRAFVFTCHTIEQVNKIPDNWFKVVANIAKYVRCVHLEPYGFQSKILGEASLAQEKFIKEQGWNLNFLEELLNANKRGEIVFDESVLEIGFGDCTNPGSIACWYAKNE